MDAFKTNGAISWHELRVDDIDAAKSFYSAVFGWTLEDMQMEGSDRVYTVIKVGDAQIGGMLPKPAEAVAMPTRWINYVTVADVDETLQQVTSKGGKVVTPPMNIPGVGRMAHLQDKEGAFIAVIAYESPV